MADLPSTLRRTASAVVLIALFMAGAAWLLIDRPVSLLVTVVVGLILSAIAGVFAVFFVPRKLGPGAQRFAIVSLACMTLIATVLAIPIVQRESRFPSKLFDDFDTGLNKWILTSSDGNDPQMSGQVYTDGKLHLEVTPSNSFDGVNATLTPMLANRPIRRISMNMALVRQVGGSDGAAYLIISSEKGREHRLWMGPNGAGEPTLGYYICHVGTCHQRSEAITDQQYPIKIGNQLRVDAFVNQAGGLQFNVNGDPLASTPPDREPITNFKFYLFSDPERDFHVTVDEVRIAYDLT